MGPGERRKDLRCGIESRPDDGDKLDPAVERDEIQGGRPGFDERGEDVGASSRRGSRRHGRVERPGDEDCAVKAS